MRIPAYARATGLGLALATTAGISSGMSAQPDLSGYQGAWVEQSLSCDKMFVTGSKGVSFRKPVNIFVPAFIISGNRIRTAQASCRILAVRPDGDREVLKLSCENSISSDDITATFARAADGSLKRFFDDNDKTGSRYERCAP